MSHVIAIFVVFKKLSDKSLQEEEFFFYNIALLFLQFKFFR